jgi:hypothetical protein
VKLNVTGKRQLILSVFCLLFLPYSHLPLQPDASSLRCHFSEIWREHFRLHMRHLSAKLSSPSAVLVPSINLRTTWKRRLDSSGLWQGQVAGFYRSGSFLHLDHLCKSTSLFFILSQIHPVHAIPTYSFKVHFNMILPCMSRSSKFLFSLGLPLKLRMYFCSPRTCLTSRPLCVPWFIVPITRWLMTIYEQAHVIPFSWFYSGTRQKNISKRVSIF